MKNINEKKEKQIDQIIDLLIDIKECVESISYDIDEMNTEKREK